MKEPLTQTNCWFGASATDQTSKTTKTKKNHQSSNFDGSHKNHSKGKSKGIIDGRIINQT
jgi:hypothetical protein